MSLHIVDKIAARTGKITHYQVRDIKEEEEEEKQEYDTYFYYSDNGEVLRSRLFIGDGKTPLTRNNLNFIINEGGFGTALKGRLYKLNHPDELNHPVDELYHHSVDELDHPERAYINCVVKIPTQLFKNGAIKINTDGSLKSVREKLKKIPPRSLQYFFQEIDYLITLNQGKALVKQGIMKPNHHIKERIFKKALKEDRDFIKKHPGHNFILTLFEYNEGLYPCIVSEFCDGDLTQVNKMWKHRWRAPSRNFFTLEDWRDEKTYNIPNLEWKNAVCEIHQGILYMHSLNIAHNDIKPQNILFKIKNNRRETDFKISCRIADFGLCSDAQPTTALCGTGSYMSPELLYNRQHPWNKRKTDPSSNDAYSLAISCLEMLFFDVNHDDAESARSLSKTKKFIRDRSISPHKTSLLSILHTMCLYSPTARLNLFNGKLKEISEEYVRDCR